MSKRLCSALVVGMLSALALPMFGAGSAAAAPNANANPHASAGKVTICHKTGSEKNPFVVITPSANGLAGHGDHQNDGDIIGGECGGGEG